MKRSFLEGLEFNGGTKLPKEIIDAIMDENGKDVQAGKDALAAKEQELSAMTTERDGLKDQIASRDKDIADLQKKVSDNADLSQQLKDLQTKYETDTTELQTKIDTQRDDFATEKFFDGLEFSSDLAKAEAMRQFKEKKFKYDPEKKEYQGANDWLEELKKNQPSAFKAADGGGDGGNNGGEGDPKDPFFVAPTNPNGGGNGGGSNPFTFGFAGVRAAPEK